MPYLCASPNTTLAASAATSHPEASTLTRTATVSSFSPSSPTSLKSLKQKSAHRHPPEQLFADRSVIIAHAEPRDYMAPQAEHHPDSRHGLNPLPLMRPVLRISWAGRERFFAKCQADLTIDAENALKNK